MAEYQDPPLRLSIEALRWMGDEWESVGEKPAGLDLFGTDQDEDASAVLRALRRIAATRLDMHTLALASARAELNFDAPNAPTEDDLSQILQHAEHILVALRALKQLAPEVIDDEDGDEDSEPAPDPEGSEVA